MNVGAETKSASTRQKKTRSRFWVQVAFFVVTLGIGLQFYMYIDQASGTGVITISRPFAEVSRWQCW